MYGSSGRTRAPTRPRRRCGTASPTPTSATPPHGSRRSARVVQTRRTNRPRRTLNCMRTLVAAAALLVLPVVPARAGTNTMTLTYVLERKPGHHGLLEITGDLDTDGGYAFAAGVTATLAGDSRYYNVTSLFFGG